MNKPALYLITIVAAAGLGWWAWSLDRGRQAAIEIPAAASANTRSSGSTSGVHDGPARTPAPAGPGAPAARGPVNVEAARAELVSLSETAFTVGTLRANESVVVKPEIAGRVDRIAFDGGSLVRKGALLVALDATVAAAEAEQIRAELALARSNYQRTADLAGQKFVSESARDQAASNLKVVEAKLKLAEAKLAKTQIRAPFSGRLGLRNFSVGDFIREGAELVVLEDVSQMKVDLRLPERYLGQLRRGQALELEFDAYPGRRFGAVLEAIDVQVDANGRSVVVRGRMSNPDGLLRAGMFAKASLTLAQRANAVVVPEEALVPAGELQFVYRIEDGKAMRVRVRIGLRRDGKVEIVEGLRGGDQVVTAGQPRLTRDATEVQVLGAVRQGG